MKFIWYPGDAGVPCAVCSKRSERGSIRIQGTHVYVCRNCVETFKATTLPDPTTPRGSLA